MTVRAQRFRIFRGNEEWTSPTAFGAPTVDEMYDAAFGSTTANTGWGNDFHRAITEARAYSQSSLRWVERAISSQVHDTQTGKVYEVNAHHPGYREIRP